MRRHERNSGEWQVEIFCRGVRVEGEEKAPLPTRAGLGSGVDLEIPGDLHVLQVNAPMSEAFARHSPLWLRGGPEGAWIEDERDGQRIAVRRVPEPSWATEVCRSGVPMGRIGRMQGSCLGIYVGEVCQFWRSGDAERCRFCATGRNVGAHEERTKSVRDVVETVARARREGVRFVHLNTGWQRGRDLEVVLPYLRAIKDEVGALVGVQTAPPADEGGLTRYDAILAAGADHLSFCLEFEDPAAFAEYCPGKAAHLGQEAFWRALEHCQSRMPKGACSGEIIVGVEPLAATHRAIERITALGAFPTVCVFRPLAGSLLADREPPEPAEILEVFRHVHRACRRHRIPMGIAPGADTSLVVTPLDTAYLVPRDLPFRAHRLRRAALRWLARPHFRRALRPRRRA